MQAYDIKHGNTLVVKAAVISHTISIGINNDIQTEEEGLKDKKHMMW